MADAKQEMNNASTQSRVVLAKPRLGGFGSSSFASSSSKACNPFGLLRPPQLKPSNNPFLKANEPSVAVDSEKDKQSENVSDERLKETKDIEAPKFVPLGSTNVTPRTSNPVPAQQATGSSGFVFGQNLSERVVMNENVNNGESETTPVDHSSTNGTTELLFTSAAASVKDNSQDEAGPSEASNSGDGLAAAAAEYERSHAKPPPPTTNYTTTGEEGELNVIQISCRLFAWGSGSWRERGRGVLRLNDAGGSGGAARLVVRVAGSLRVVLNTKLWPDMVVERAGTKSLRITAADAQQQVKLFLIMGAPSDIVQLYKALSARVSMTKRSVPCKQNSTSQTAAERLEAATDDSEFLDKPADAIDGVKHNSDDTEESHDSEDKKALKRKEPTQDETSPKRQCPEILIE